MIETKYQLGCGMHQVSEFLWNDMPESGASASNAVMAWQALFQGDTTSAACSSFRGIWSTHIQCGFHSVTERRLLQGRCSKTPCSCTTLLL